MGKDIYLKKLGPMLSYLETMISCGKFAPGEALPSLRKLAADFAISRGLANQGVSILAERGLVDIRHGSGAYVLAREKAEAASERKLCIGVILETDKLDRTYCAHVYRGVRDAAERYPECSLFEYMFDIYEEFSDAVWQTICRDSDAVLMIGACDLMIKNVSRNLPVIGVEMGNDYDGWVSLLSLDPYDAARQSVAYFRERGISRVVAYRGFIDPLHELRNDIFRWEWEKAGGGHCFRTLDEIFADPESDHEVGYWFSGSSEYNALNCHWLEKHGRAFNADRTVLTLDGKGLLIPNFAPSDTISCDWRLVGESAFGEVLRRIKNPGAPAQRIDQHGILRLMK